MKRIVTFLIAIVLIVMAIIAYTTWNGVKLARALPERLKSEYKINTEEESRYLKLSKLFKSVVIDTAKLPMIGESVEIIPPEYNIVFAQKAFQDYEADFLKVENLTDLERTRKFYAGTRLCAGTKLSFKQTELMALFLIIHAKSLINEKPEKAVEIFSKVIKFGADVTKGISLDSSIISVVFGSGLITLCSRNLLKIHEKTPELLNKYKPFYKMIKDTRPTFVDIIKTSQTYTQKFVKIVTSEMGFHFKILNFFYGDPSVELGDIYKKVFVIFSIKDEPEKLKKLNEFFSKYPAKISHPLVKMVFLNFLKSYTSYEKMLVILGKIAN